MEQEKRKLELPEEISVSSIKLQGGRIMPGEPVLGWFDMEDRVNAIIRYLKAKENERHKRN